MYQNVSALRQWRVHLYTIQSYYIIIFLIYYEQSRILHNNRNDFSAFFCDFCVKWRNVAVWWDVLY